MKKDKQKKNEDLEDSLSMIENTKSVNVTRKVIKLHKKKQNPSLFKGIFISI